MTAYRFNAQHVFLTYAQTKRLQTPNKLRELVGSRAEIKDYLISQERHVDGGYHLHAYLKFTKKLDRTSSGLFGWTYYNKLNLPHVQLPRSKHKLWKYIKKDKDFITNLDETRPRWLVNLEDSSDLEEFLLATMWDVGRIDNYAGYRTYRDLWQLKADWMGQAAKTRVRLPGKLNKFPNFNPEPSFSYKS